VVNLAEIAVTDHALMRFRRRLRRPRATVEEVADALRGGHFRIEPPDSLNLDRTKETFGYVVTREAIFPIVKADLGGLCATTVIRRKRRSKADIRAHREMMRGLL
jgi:hypothetical protein